MGDQAQKMESIGVAGVDGENLAIEALGIPQPARLMMLQGLIKQAGYPDWPT
jgi:hypothetical protein